MVILANSSPLKPISMKHMYLFITAVFAICSLQSVQGQTNSLEIGDKLILGAPSGSTYSHVNVPRKNFIIKRGGIAKIASLMNTSIVVTDITYGTKTLITFKRSDGRKFFRVYKTLSADFDGGINAGELILPEVQK